MRALYPEPPGAGFHVATFWVYRGNFETQPLPLAETYEQLIRASLVS